MPDDVQPDEGQGTGGLFDSYLQNVPEEHREAVTGYLRDAEKNVNTRLSEAAELQKTFGGYKDIEALSNYPPEQLSELLAWHGQVTSSEDAFKQWLANAAQEAGLTLAEQEGLEDAIDQGDLSRDEIQKLVEERATQQLAPLEQRVQQWEEQRQTDIIEQEINTDLSRLEGEHKVKFTDEQKAMIIDLGLNHEGDGSWVEAGFARFNEIGAERARTFVAEADQQPQAAVTSGGIEAFKPSTSWAEVQKQARARWTADTV